MSENPILETETEEDSGAIYNVATTGSEISIAWGDLSIAIRSDDQSLDDIEDRLFSVLEKLKESLNSGKYHDPAHG